MTHMKIISGGQTGADRGALDAARCLGLETGGYAPAGFRTERGPDPALAAFGLVPRGDYRQRTAANVRAADATVIFAVRPSPGSDLTRRVALAEGKPHLVVNPFAPDAARTVGEFLDRHQPRTLNVAGHRESVAPGIQARVETLLLETLRDRRLSCPN